MKLIKLSKDSLEEAKNLLLINDKYIESHKETLVKEYLEHGETNEVQEWRRRLIEAKALKKLLKSLIKNTKDDQK